jgi:hypothetical protein
MRKVDTNTGNTGNRWNLSEIMDTPNSWIEPIRGRALTANFEQVSELLFEKKGLIPAVQQMLTEAPNQHSNGQTKASHYFNVRNFFVANTPKDPMAAPTISITKSVNSALRPGMKSWSVSVKPPNIATQTNTKIALTRLGNQPDTSKYAKIPSTLKRTRCPTLSAY